MLDAMTHSTFGRTLATVTAAAVFVLLLPRPSLAQGDAPAAPPPPEKAAEAKPAYSGPPRVLVVGVVAPTVETQVDPAVGRRLGQDLARELGSSGKLKLFPNKKVLAALTEVDPAAVASRELTQISKEVAQGRKLLDDLKLEEAIVAFSAAIEGYKKNLVFMKNYSPLVQTLLQLSVAYFRIGEEEKGQGFLTQVLCLQPDMSLAEGEFPEIFTRIFDEVKKKSIEGPKGSINVASSPPFSEIYLNGSKRGVTPLLVRDLIKGRYFIRVDKQGYKPYNAEIEVGDKEGELVQVNLEPEPRVVQYNKKQVYSELEDYAKQQQWKNPDFQKKAKLVCGWLDVDFLVFGLIVIGDLYEMTPFLFRATDGGMMALPTLKMDRDLLNSAIELYKMTEVANEKITFFPDDPPRLPKIIKPEGEFMVVAPPPDDPEVIGPGPGPDTSTRTGTGTVTEDKWYKKWWVWTLIVVGAGAVAGGAVGISMAVKPEGKPTTTVRWPR